jgi:hypothetical protein
VAASIACSTAQTAPATGLELIIVADGLSAPADFDDVELQISEEADGGDWSLKWKRDYVVPSAEASLPATFAIGSGGSPDEEALISVTALKGGPTGQPVVQRVVQAQVPSDRLAALYLVLAKLCEGQVVSTGPGGAPVSTCPAGESCQPGNGQCGGDVINPSTLTPYAPGEDLDAGISLGLLFGDAGIPGMPAGDAGSDDATIEESGDAASEGSNDAADGSFGDGPIAEASTEADASDAALPEPEPEYLKEDAPSGFAYVANFGSPYDSILAAPVDTTQSAIAPGFQTAAVGASTSSVRFQLIASSADLYAALAISPSLSVSTGLSSVNAKTSFVQGMKFDTTDLWVLADLSQAGTVQIVSPTLSPAAAALSPEDFYASFGDRYASQIVTGAEVFCAVQIPTTSSLDKSTLAAALGFAYGSSSVSTGFASAVTAATTGRTVNVSCRYLGFSPNTPMDTLPSLLNAAQAFQSGTATSLGSVTPWTLGLVYTSYYGLPGYPGVPAGIAMTVADEAPLGPEFLLYDSLVKNDFAAYYADTSDSNLPFFADMKAYRDALSAFLSASIANSLDPGLAVPTPPADGVITDWLPVETLSSGGSAAPQFTTYGIQNGVVPKRISDYAIPLRYAYPAASGNGALKGVTFPPVAAIQPAPSASSTSPIDYPLYVVHKAGAGAPWLEYEWDTGTYDFANVTNAQGAPNAAAIGTAITTLGLSGNLSAAYLVVSKASGLVLTDNGAASPLTATHLATGSTHQLWNFYLDAGSFIDNCATYVPPAAADTAGSGCTIGNNTVASAANNPPCGSLIYGISSAAVTAMSQGYWEVPQAGVAGSAVNSNGGGGCDDCDWNCGGVHCEWSTCGGGPVPNDDFFLQPYDNGNTQAIYNYVASRGVVSYAVTSPTQTEPTSSSESVVVASSIAGNANELWVFIPSTNVDTNP